MGATEEAILLKKRQDLRDAIATGDPATIVAAYGQRGLEYKQDMQYTKEIKKLQNINTTT